MWVMALDTRKSGITACSTSGNRVVSYLCGMSIEQISSPISITYLNSKGHKNRVSIFCYGVKITVDFMFYLKVVLRKFLDCKLWLHYNTND